MESKSMESCDGQATICITRDSMEAYLTVHPPREEGRPADETVVADALSKAGVVYGIDTARISEALEQRNWGKPILVARGELPVNGEDGWIEYKFPLPGEIVGPAETPDGRVDYRNLNLVHNVVQGQLLAIKHDPVPGKPGMTITGKPLMPREGKHVPLLRGKNTVLDESGCNLYAAVDGHVTIVEDKVVVNQLYEVRGDVDLSTGNIDFVGDVSIAGVVTSGFVVKAGGTIEINGGVESAQVIAGGNILIRKGVTGGDKGLVQAKGSVMARFIENARISAGDEVIVSDAIVQSQVHAGRAVKVEGGKGTIVGGSIQARDEISARVIGSTFATQTYLEVGVDPLLREEYRTITREYQQKRKAFEVVSQNLQVKQKSLMLAEALPERQRLVLIKLLEEYKNLNTELKQMEERLAFLEGEFNRLQGGRIKVLDLVYPGVHITMGRAVYVVNDPIKYAMFVLENGEIRITSIS